MPGRYIAESEWKFYKPFSNRQWYEPLTRHRYSIPILNQLVIDEPTLYRNETDPYRRIDYVYDLQAFFGDHHTLKISEVSKEVAKPDGLSPSLARQYASGIKQASPLQVKKIETAIDKLARSLLDLQLI